MLGIDVECGDDMSLSGKERRTFAEIEQALTMGDPEFARRIAMIDRIESGVQGSSVMYGKRVLAWVKRPWVIAVAAVVILALLVLAVITA